MFNRVKNFILKLIVTLQEPINRPGFFVFLFPSNYFFFKKFNFIPRLQIPVYRVLLDLYKYINEQSINLILAHGTLLGAIRSNSFAGRPKDLDFYITANDFNKFMTNNFNFMISFIKVYKGVIHFKRPYGVIISFTIIKETTSGAYVRDNNFFVNHPVLKDIMDRKKSYKKFKVNLDDSHLGNPLNISLTNRESIFNLEFYVPDNAHQLLVLQYGNEWQKVSGKQYGQIN